MTDATAIKAYDGGDKTSACWGAGWIALCVGVNLDASERAGASLWRTTCRHEEGNTHGNLIHGVATSDALELLEHNVIEARGQPFGRLTEHGSTIDYGRLQFTLQGFDKLTSDAMGTLRMLSDEFELCGLPWNLEVLPQGHVLDASEKGRFLSCYLKLLDVKLLPADELPYVRFEITLVNRCDSKRNITRVFENQYGQHPNSTWGTPTFLELSKLQEMREEFMPDGHLQVKVAFKRCVKAREAAALRKCSVAEVLDQASRSCKEPSRMRMNEQIAGWIQGDRSRLRADAVVVCNAISKDKMLSRRICRYIGTEQAACKSEGEGPEYPGLTYYDATTSACLGPALMKLREVMAHKPAMRKLLAHFGGCRPHAAVASCLAVDPAGLERHINEAVGPQGGAAGPCATRRRTMQERWRLVIFGSAGPAGRFFSSSSKHT